MRWNTLQPPLCLGPVPLVLLVQILFQRSKLIEFTIKFQTFIERQNQKRFLIGNAEHHFRTFFMDSHYLLSSSCYRDC